MIRRMRFFFILFLVLSSLHLLACSTNNIPAISACDLLVHPSHYDGKTVRLKSEIVVGPHGGHIFNQNCAHTGSVKVVYIQSLDRSKKLFTLMRSMMSHGRSGKVIFIGVYHSKKDMRSPYGKFTVHKILNMEPK